MSQLRPPRGTHDLLGDDARRHRHVADTARAVAELYGYGEIATPVFEFTEVFQRTLGETSDIVTKEMYTFEDRGGDRITLRPENTAGVVRAVITGGLTQELPLRFFYTGLPIRRPPASTHAPQSAGSSKIELSSRSSCARSKGCSIRIRDRGLLPRSERGGRAARRRLDRRALCLRAQRARARGRGTATGCSSRCTTARAR